MATFWATFGKYLATFYSNIWSHWPLNLNLSEVSKNVARLKCQKLDLMPQPVILCLILKWHSPHLL